MPVVPKTQHLQVNPSQRLDVVLIPYAFTVRIRRQSVRQKNIFRIYIDMAEEVLLHKPEVALVIFL